MMVPLSLESDGELARSPRPRTEAPRSQSSVSGSLLLSLFWVLPFHFLPDACSGGWFEGLRRRVGASEGIKAKFCGFSIEEDYNNWQQHRSSFSKAGSHEWELHPPPHPTEKRNQENSGWQNWLPWSVIPQGLSFSRGKLDSPRFDFKESGICIYAT